MNVVFVDGHVEGIDMTPGGLGAVWLTRK